MIDLNEKPRRSFKRKFEENDRSQPKETLLDISVSKLAKAHTKVNLEPSLRKTVMIVNTIRKLEYEIEIGRTKTPNHANSYRHCSRQTTSDENTRPVDSTVFTLVRTQISIEKEEESIKPTLDSWKGEFHLENNSETSKNRCSNNTKTIVKSCPSDDTFIDLAKSTEMKFKNRFDDAAVLTSSNILTTAECEINFSEVDISLYDFDSWSECGPQIPSIDDSEPVYTVRPTTFYKRCSDDLKLEKSNETSLVDDLDQIMQVLVSI